MKMRGLSLHIFSRPLLFLLLFCLLSTSLSAQHKEGTRLIDEPEPIEQVFIDVNLSFVGTLNQQYTPALSYSFTAEGGIVTFAAFFNPSDITSNTQNIVQELNNRLILTDADTLMRFTACTTSLAQDWYDFTIEILPNNTYSESRPTKGVERTINLNFSASTGAATTISVWQPASADRPELFPPWPDDSTAIVEPFVSLVPNTSQDNEPLTNWIKKITYIGDDPYTPTDSIVDIVYYNGLGQPKQMVQVGAAANSRRNIVTPVMYDPLGRALREYLPYISTSSTESYDAATSTKQAAWYKSQYGNSELHPYRESFVEAGLQRPIRLFNAGSLFRNATPLPQTSSIGPQGRYISTEYKVSSAEDRVPCLEVVGNSLVKRGYYSMGSFGNLTKTVTTNEDGVTIATFTDNREQLILQRTYLSGIDEGPSSNWSDLVYAYNDQQLPALIITPQGEALRDTLQNEIPLSSAWAKEYCYRYRYDGQGRMISKRLPGRGEELLILSPAGLICVTQDSLLRERNLWFITQYDECNRPIKTLLSPPAFTEAQMRAMFNYSYQQAVNGYIPAIYSRTDNTTLTKSNYGRTATEYHITIGPNFELVRQPSSNTITLSFIPEERVIDVSDVSTEKGPKVLTESVIQSSYPDGSRLAAGYGASQGIANPQSTTPQYKHTAYFYDHRARLIQKQTLYPDGSRLIESTRYNYIGEPLRQAVRLVMPYASAGGSAADTLTALLTQTFTYDKRGRILTQRDTLKKSITQTVGTTSQTFATYASYAYDELGRVKIVNTANTARAFTYNIQDWVTELQAKRGTQVIYSQALKYYNPTKSATTPLYSGNISEWQTSQYSNGADFSTVGATANTITNAFSYDNSGRLTASNLYQGNNITATTAFTERGITYDRNGNILTLSRMAQSTTTPLHNFSYSYNADKLTAISGTENGNPLTASFTYNGNGDMSYDGMQNIALAYELGGNTSIIREGSQTGTIKAAYSYFADGEKAALANTATKQQRIYRGPFTIIKAPDADNSEVAILESADALGGNARFAYAATPVIQPSTGDTLSIAVTYDLLHIIKDHLGSIRAILTSDGNIRDRHDYYPFGLRTDQGRAYPTFSDRYTVKVPRLTQGPNGTITHTEYRATAPYTLQYNGKELQLLANTSLIDYGARQYNPTLARWTTQDPMAEKYYNISPYAYCYNNPTLFLDPNMTPIEYKQMLLTREGDSIGGGLHVLSLFWNPYLLLFVRPQEKG